MIILKHRNILNIGFGRSKQLKKNTHHEIIQATNKYATNRTLIEHATRRSESAAPSPTRPAARARPKAPPCVAVFRPLYKPDVNVWRVD